MTAHQGTISKIQQLPDLLIEEVSDFVDFLLMKRDNTRRQMWTHFVEASGLVESDFVDYLSNLEDYENRLARGEIQW